MRKKRQAVISIKQEYNSIRNLININLQTFYKIRKI